MHEAAVVGSGPNGLGAAVTLARAGWRVTVYEAAEEIGGGARSAELTLPGLLHDECSAFHPMGAASPLLRSLETERHGLRWKTPEIQLAHPLDGGRAGVLHRSLDETEQALGEDGPAWRGVFGPVVSGFDTLFGEVGRGLLRPPRRPLRLARFGLRATQPATMLARRWAGPEARALFGGVAAHAAGSLRRPLSAAVGVLLGAAGHAHGWPVAEGGSRAVHDALARTLDELGGVVKTASPIRSLDELSGSDLVLLDVAPPAAAGILGSRMPRRVSRSYRRYRFGPAAFKLDLAVRGGIPWENPDCARAGTVHLGGTLEEIALAEREVSLGRMPERPFVLVGQQYLADPARSAGELHPVWCYAHVPNGYTGDSAETAELLLGQIERFAPGVRRRIEGWFLRGPADLQRYNPNYVGGDIGTGATDWPQLVFRPRVTPHPYRTGVAGVYLCSAATPPGAGVHGMCGFNAARAALHDLS